MPYPIRLFLPFIIITTLLSACGGPRHLIRGEPPRLDIDNIEHHVDRLSITLAIRNLNDRTLEISTLNMTLQLDGELLADAEYDSAFDIPARSRELVRMEATPQAVGLNRLQALADGDPSSMRWEVEAVLTDHRGRDRQVDGNGWLHAVPGQEHRFR